MVAKNRLTYRQFLVFQEIRVHYDENRNWSLQWMSCYSDIIPSISSSLTHSVKFVKDLLANHSAAKKDTCSSHLHHATGEWSELIGLKGGKRDAASL